MKFSFSFSLFPSTPHFLGHAGECCISSKDNLLFCLFYGYRTNNCAGLHGDNIVQFSSVAQSLRPHRLQHSRFPRPPPTPRGYSNSFPLSWWCHQTISSSVIPLSSCLQIFLARVSSLYDMAKELEFQLQHQSFQWILRINLPSKISLQSKGLWIVFSNTTVQKHQFSALSFLYSPTLTSLHDYWKNHSLN